MLEQGQWLFRLFRTFQLSGPGFPIVSAFKSYKLSCRSGFYPILPLTVKKWYQKRLSAPNNSVCISYRHKNRLSIRLYRAKMEIHRRFYKGNIEKLINFDRLSYIGVGVCLWIWENETKRYHPLKLEIYNNGPDQFSSSILYFETYVFHLEILLQKVFYLGALSPPIPLIWNTLATQQEEKNWVGMESGAPEASLFPPQKRSFYINLPVHNARPDPQSISFGPWMESNRLQM